MADTLGVQINTNIYAEFIIRSGKSVDVANWIENIVQDYLDRTEGDDLIWSKAHAERAEAKLDENFESLYGDPDGSYQWGELFLRNGVKLRMNYKSRNYYAEVRDEEIVFEEMSYSPSQWTSKIAGGTSRNAWRDIWIKERGSDRWVLADDLRRSARAITPTPLSAFLS